MNGDLSASSNLLAAEVQRREPKKAKAERKRRARNISAKGEVLTWKCFCGKVFQHDSSFYRHKRTLHADEDVSFTIQRMKPGEKAACSPAPESLMMSSTQI